MPQLDHWTQTPATGKNHKMRASILENTYRDWSSSAADRCAMDSMPSCTQGTQRSAHLAQQGALSGSSEDGKRNWFAHSPGEAVQHVTGFVDALRWLSNSDATKPNTFPNYQNLPVNTLGTFYPHWGL